MKNMVRIESDRARKSWEDFEQRIGEIDKQKEEADRSAETIYLQKVNEARRFSKIQLRRPKRNTKKM